MTRDHTKTLQWLKTNVKHTHPGQVWGCTDWTCDEFLDVVGSVFAANEALRFENECLSKEIGEIKAMFDAARVSMENDRAIRAEKLVDSGLASKEEIAVLMSPIGLAESKALEAMGLSSIARAEYVEPKPKKKAKK